MSSVAAIVSGGAVLASVFGSAWTGWSWAILVLGLIALFVVALLHMLSISLNIPSLKVWVKGEYMQVIATYLLVFLITAGFLPLVWGVVSSFAATTVSASAVGQAQSGYAGLAAQDPFSFVQEFLKQDMIECEQNVYKALYSVNFFYKIVGSTKTETLGVEPVGGWYTTVYTSFFEYVIEHMNFLLLLNWLQIRLLSVMKYVAPLMIMMGLILRTFPSSRGAGGMLIAMGFGFFAVYPISLAMLVTLQPAGQTFCTQVAPPPMLDVAQVGGAPNMAGVVNAYYAVSGTGQEVSGFISKVKNFIPVFYMQSMFFPLVAIVITFTFIRQSGAIFGSDLNEIGRGMVKLI